MLNRSNERYHTRSYFDQWIDGYYQYDPAAGGRDGFAHILCEYGSSAYFSVIDFIRTRHVPGMVTMYREEFRGYRKRAWTPGPVRFEFQHRGVAMLACLHAGGAA